jgi:hypothetical protein
MLAQRKRTEAFRHLLAAAAEILTGSARPGPPLQNKMLI